MNARYVPFRTWIKVESSNVAQIWYDPPPEILRVRFYNKRNGLVVGYRSYAYGGVPLPVYLGFLQSLSKGRFVWTDLREKYAYVETTGTAEA